jgi:hypothetical protein
MKQEIEQLEPYRKRIRGFPSALGALSHSQNQEHRGNYIWKEKNHLFYFEVPKGNNQLGMQNSC